MKKILMVLLVLVLLLSGLFFYKGGHHVLVVSNALDEWLDADSADQVLTIHYRHPDLSLDSATGKVKQEMTQWTLTADSFWTEYADAQIFGLSAGGITAYLCGRNLYLDTGKAYALPEVPELKEYLKQVSLGLLIYGRMTKTGDTYHLSMETEELDLSVSVSLARTVRAVTVNAVLPDETIIDVALTCIEPLPHSIPQSVVSAMALARKEPPMSLTEPLEVLLPAAENLLPLTGDLKLGVSSGILEVSETVQLTLCDGKAALTRNGIHLELPLDLSELSPLTMSALILREGEFAGQPDGAVLTVNLSAETATELLEALVPQTADLGITLGDSTLYLYIKDDRLTSASLTATGSVPFLFTTIPVDFSAELTVS